MPGKWRGTWPPICRTGSADAAVRRHCIVLESAGCGFRCRAEQFVDAPDEHRVLDANDYSGCCYGSCTHVWNYEQATAFVFPSLARSIRESEFLRNTAENGQMAFRTYLPDGKKIWDHAAADGQLGCLMKLYRDWQLCGDTEWLRRLWPQAKKALEFAWIKGGWDENRDGVAEGVQAQYL